MDEVEIRPFADATETLDALERLFIAEWGAWYGTDGPGNARADLVAAMNRDRLPLGLVACGAGGTALGTAMLKAESVGSDLGYGPFLAAFVVAPAHRGRGIGSALVAAVEAAATRLGFAALYGATDSADGLLLRRGWVACDTAPSSRGMMTIYRKGLSEPG